MSRIIECWRCNGSGYIEACYECDRCGGCGTVVEEDKDPDDNLDDFIPEEEGQAMTSPLELQEDYRRQQ